MSVQRCRGTTSAEGSFDRLGSVAFYAFVYPNFMINRYDGTIIYSLFKFKTLNQITFIVGFLLSFDCSEKCLGTVHGWTLTWSSLWAQLSVKLYLITS